MLDNVRVKTTRVYRIDADVIVTPEFGVEVVSACKEHHDDDVNGFDMKFLIAFMGTFLRHGGVYPFYNLTIFKFDRERYENRAMGEHVILREGKCLDLKNDCSHYDFKSLDAWIDEHNCMQLVRWLIISQPARLAGQIQTLSTMRQRRLVNFVIKEKISPCLYWGW